MTDQELNRRVAELAGWTNISPKFHATAELCGFHQTHTEGHYMTSIPNYTTSRDAIIGLIEGLSDNKQEEILLELCGMYSWQPVVNIDLVCSALTASARDLCLAYVKVMGGGE